MTHTQDSKRYFPHERLAAWRLAKDVVEFLHARGAKLRGLPGESGPQLMRAAVGAYTNLCAGAATFGAEARRHFRIALSEAGEAGGCIELALRFGALTADEHAELRRTLLRLCACLRGLST